MSDDNKVWRIKKELIERLNKLRDKHTEKANDLLDKNKVSEASDEIMQGLGIGEAIHEILYRHEGK